MHTAARELGPVPTLVDSSNALHGYTLKLTIYGQDGVNTVKMVCHVKKQRIILFVHCLLSYTGCCKNGILSWNLHVQHGICKFENKIRNSKFAKKYFIFHIINYVGHVTYYYGELIFVLANFEILILFSGFYILCCTCRFLLRKYTFLYHSVESV